jgi:hypothetical protein
MHLCCIEKLKMYLCSTDIILCMMCDNVIEIRSEKSIGFIIIMIIIIIIIY